MRRRFFSYVILLATVLFLFPQKAEARMEPDYTMALVLCSCGVYKEQCEPFLNGVCDVSAQQFCSDVC